MTCTGKFSIQQPPQVQANFWKPTKITLTFILLGSILSGSAVGQGDSSFAVRNERKKDFPATEAARIYEAVCVVVAREVRPEHPPLLQPHFTLVLGADKNELVDLNQVSELRLESWDREKFAQGVVILAVREIVRREHITQLSRRALAWTDAVVPLAELADSK